MVWVILAITLMLLGTLGAVGQRGALGSGPPAGSAGGVPLVPAATSTEVNITSFTPQSTLPTSFWSTTAVAASPIDSNSSLEVNATSAREIVFPGGYLADQMDLINGTITGNRGGVSQAQTTTAQFVSWCESIGCHAIMEVPGEINSTSTAAAYVRYVEQTLHYHPDYWEIGNEPAIWKKYNLPWSEWATHNSSAPTPAQYALLVHSYIAAMRTVDPNIRIIGMPGTGTGTFGETNWLSATVSENGPNLSAVAIHVYPGGPGPTNPANVTLTEFLTTLSSHASLPVRVPLDIAAIQAACPSCGPIPLLVTEFGSAISGKLQDTYIDGFPQAVYIGSELIQAAELPIANMAYWSLEHDNPSAWFPTPGADSRPVYQLYAEIMSRMGPNVLPTTVTSTVPGVYALATEGSSSTTPIDLLVINSNATQPITFSTSATGLDVSGPLETWTWNSSSSEPVAHYWATGLPASWQEPAASIVLFEEPRTPSFPLTVTESGLPSHTRWFFQVGSVTETTNSTQLTFFLPNGQYDQTFLATEYPATGERIALSVPPTVTINNAPVSESGTYGLQYLLSTSANPSSGGTTSPSSAWISAGTSTTIEALAASGYQFTGWSGSGAGSYSGTADPATVSPSAPVTEVAEFSSSSVTRYQVTFTESTLPSGTEWWVNLTGQPPLSSTGTSVGISLTNGNYPYTVASADKSYSAPGGEVTVNGAAQSVSITFSSVTYTVTFTESGLPSGTEWWVNLTGGQSLSSTGTSVSLSLQNGSYPYTVASANKAYSSPGGEVTVNGAAQSVPITFSQAKYGVTFTESGLPSGTEWWVNITGGPSLSSTGTSVSTSLADGSYTYTVASAAKSYSAPGGDVTVNGAAQSVPITFSQATYGVTFTESGLPGGTQWWANITGGPSLSSTGTSVSTSLADGSYTYTVASAAKRYHASGGVVTVNGAAQSVPITFSQVTYGVTFTESGLPSGTQWWVNITGGPSLSSVGTSVSASLSNGTYSFVVATANKTFSSPGGGVVVKGSSASVSITFTLVTYSVGVTESGLPAGAEWWTNLSNAQTFHATGPTITFNEPNGSYGYVLATSASGYAASGGAFTVHGRAVSQAVVFVRGTYVVTFTESGLPSGTGWWANVSGPVSQTQESTYPEISSNLPNGSYDYHIATTNPVYSAPGGSFTVSGAALAESVVFTRVTFTVTFTESGLPTGHTWWVNLTDGESFSGTQPAISFPESNGTYSYAASSVGWAPSPAQGDLRVQGSPVSVSITFSQTLFTVTFAESGLPPGTIWSVAVDGLTHSSPGSTVGFAEEVGTHHYTVNPIGNWVPFPGSGNVTITASDISVSVAFSFTYELTIDRPGGVSAGTGWSITLNGTEIPSVAAGSVGSITRSATGATIVFDEPNGTYSYTAAVAGHPSYRATGSTTIHGAPRTVTLPALSGSSTSGGIPIAYLAIGAVIAAAVVALVAVMVRQRHRRPPAHRSH